jgi:hypothetical protein
MQKEERSEQQGPPDSSNNSTIIFHEQEGQHQLQNHIQGPPFETQIVNQPMLFQHEANQLMHQQVLLMQHQPFSAFPY